MQMLVRMEPDIETYLRMQNSEEELRNLKEKYKKPDGRPLSSLCGRYASGVL